MTSNSGFPNADLEGVRNNLGPWISKASATVQALHQELLESDEQINAALEHEKSVQAESGKLAKSMSSSDANRPGSSSCRNDGSERINWSKHDQALNKITKRYKGQPHVKRQGN